MTRLALVTLLASACTVAEACPEDSGTWYVDFTAAAPCGVPNAATYKALKDTCERVSVSKAECAQDVEFSCPNGVRIVQSTDPAAGYGTAMIERGDCVAFVEGEIK